MLYAAGAGASGLDAAPVEADSVVPDELDVDADPLSLFDASAPPVDAVSDFASFFAEAVEPLRKSVTYQPVPFSWKPAAVTIFEKVA